ncbi:MAG: type II toxin-antitoxin system VapC family toxin [Burkholderiaceae bacterium]
MRLLLDTQVSLWWLGDHPGLTKQARARIADASSVYLSSVSIWEAAIKIGIGKLRANLDALVHEIPGSGFEELPVTSRHAAAVARRFPTFTVTRSIVSCWRRRCPSRCAC